MQCWLGIKARIPVELLCCHKEQKNSLFMQCCLFTIPNPNPNPWWWFFFGFFFLFFFLSKTP